MNSAAAKEENKADKRAASRYGCSNTKEMQRLLAAQDLSERSVQPEAEPDYSIPAAITTIPRTAGAQVSTAALASTAAVDWTLQTR